MEVPTLYHEMIDWVGDGTGLPDTILHIHAGMVMLMLGRVITRRSLGAFVPLLIALGAEIANEVMDRLYFCLWRWADTAADFVNTLFWPTIICIGVRIRPLSVDNAPLDQEPSSG